MVKCKIKFYRNLDCWGCVCFRLINASHVVSQLVFYFRFSSYAVSHVVTLNIGVDQRSGTVSFAFKTRKPCCRKG